MSHWIFYEPAFEDNQEKFKKYVDSYEILKKGERPRYFYNTHNKKGILWAPLECRPSGCIVYGKPENLKCSDYYPLYSDLLLNEKHCFVNAATFTANKEFYFREDTLFVRPDRADKPFDGAVICKNTNAHDLRRYIFGDFKDTILIAPTQTIQEEYRFVIIDNVVVTGSFYKRRKGHHLEFYEKEIKKGAAWDFAQASIRYNPSRAFTMDVCLTDSGFKIVELNSFSHAGLYNCNIRKIVDAFE